MAEQAHEEDDTQNIRIYLRLRPVARQSQLVQVLDDDRRVEITVAKDAATGIVNNQQERFIFQFNGVFVDSATQDQVFEQVAQPVVASALEGINGTVFAYGATGSGKTFTVTGGVGRYVDRGLIPRAVSHVFAAAAERPDCTLDVHVSYLEIYNDAGYDLLDPGREAKSMEDLPRVSVYEDETGATRLRNLALHPAATEEAALNLLFLGDTNRAISETPMNMASSRSHCIFTLHIASRQAGRSTVLRSKLHLVDLAGSERIKRSGMEGAPLLREAKHINLSLHFLEQVIVALQERATSGRAHVPYRNSMMTLMLRDSLGGNCRTVMIATVAPSGDQLLESVSTCRFAQRVAMIANEVRVNEEEDPALVIAGLRQEVADLKAELQLAQGEEQEPDTPREAAWKVAAVHASVDAFFHNTDPAATLEVQPPRMPLFRAAFVRLKALARWTGSSAAAAGSFGGASNEAVEKLRAQIAGLQQQLKQRDAEVAVLVGMRPAPDSAVLAPNGSRHNRAAADPSQLAHPQTRPSEPRQNGGSQDTGSAGQHPRKEKPEVRRDVSGDDEALQRAFEEFRRGYAGQAAMQSDKALLASSYSEAKALAEQVNGSKRRIDELKAALERTRVQRALPNLGQVIMSSSSADMAIAPPDEEERADRLLLDQEKAMYRNKYAQLAKKKEEVEKLQEVVMAARQRVQSDFQQWMQDGK
ncbi:hypothetical protein WJX73_003057 [Symbiochloris irregularis]|uniref:Kinesin-like protein n=1 Tax=Symbiochloris irregularis TaxID=706552 RepID=A0AAW1NTH0_9CHLO